MDRTEINLTDRLPIDIDPLSVLLRDPLPPSSVEPSTPFKGTPVVDPSNKFLRGLDPEHSTILHRDTLFWKCRMIDECFMQEVVVRRQIGA